MNARNKKRKNSFMSVFIFVFEKRKTKSFQQARPPAKQLDIRNASKIPFAASAFLLGLFFLAIQTSVGLRIGAKPFNWNFFLAVRTKSVRAFFHPGKSLVYFFEFRFD